MRLLYAVAMVVLGLVGLYALLQVFLAADPWIFAVAIVVLAAVVVGIVHLRRHRPVPG